MKPPYSTDLYDKKHHVVVGDGDPRLVMRNSYQHIQLSVRVARACVVYGIRDV